MRGLSWIKNPLSLFRAQLPPFLKEPILLLLLLSSMMSLIVLVAFFSLQPVLPLFYSLAQPSDYLVPKMWLVIFPIISFLINFIHFLFLKSIRMYEKIIQQIYVWITVLVQLLLLLALIRILIIVS